MKIINENEHAWISRFNCNKTHHAEIKDEYEFIIFSNIEKINRLKHNKDPALAKAIEDAFSEIEPYECLTYYYLSGFEGAMSSNLYEHFSNLRNYMIKTIFNNKDMHAFCLGSYNDNNIISSIKAFYLKSFYQDSMQFNTTVNEKNQFLLDQLQIIETDFNKNISNSEAELSKIQANSVCKRGLDYQFFKTTLMFNTSEDARKQVYITYYNRCTGKIDSYKNDNSQNVLRSLELRQQMAQNNGFDNYAEMAIRNNVINNASHLSSVLQRVANHYNKLAASYCKEILSFSKSIGYKSYLDHWDIDHLTYLYFLNQGMFSLSSTEKLFSLESAISCLFKLLRGMLGLSFERLTADKTVADTFFKHFRVYNENGNIIGELLLDLYARPGKQGIYWTSSYNSYHKTSMGEEKLPIVMVVCNFENTNQSALLSHNDLLTLFHEFGHALHGLLARNSSVSLSGLNSASMDMLEFPSQFMENFCWESDILYAIYQSDKSEFIKDNSFDSFILYKKFMETFNLLFQAKLALFDFELYSLDKFDINTSKLMYEKIERHFGIFPPCREINFSNSFFHGFNQHYAAQYHCYLLSQFNANSVYDAQTSLLDAGNRLVKYFRDPSLLYETDLKSLEVPPELGTLG